MRTRWLLRSPRRRLTWLTTLVGCAALICAALIATAGALATHGPDVETTVGSNDAVFPQNKQNEPTVAVNPVNPTQVGAGANDEIDLEACNVEEDNTCPFTEGVGVTGFQASLSGGASWLQPDYTGYSARHCTPPPDPAPDTCTPDEDGPIGTVPWYFEEGLVSDGDPVQAWGPRPGLNGSFSWSNGARLYFQDLTSNFAAQRDEQAFRGLEAIAVSRTDRFADAAGGVKSAWLRPVIISQRLSAVTFSDKNWIVADDAASSPFFGNVYACWVSFRSVGLGGAPEPVMFSRSTDGGDTWSGPRQLTQAANTAFTGRQGCQVETDGDGVVYVFFLGGDPRTRSDVQFMTRSFDGGRRFERPRPVARVENCGRPDVATGRLSFDGIAGARTNSFPSVSIANGAPLGNGPDTVFLTWCDGPTPSVAAPGANEQALVRWSTDKGETWQGPANAALPGDRPDFPAIAASPDGTDLYLTYMAFHAPWQPTTSSPRLFEGVVLHANVAANGTPGAFTLVHRGAAGDARGSAQNNLVAEFLGDYNAVSATNDIAVAVWNDARDASDCPAIDTWRQAQLANPTLAAPAPQVACPATFGNTDIRATRVSDPTP
jgi:hypothetical protein